MENVFEQKNSFKVYMQLAIPLVLSSLVSMIYNIVDTYFISFAQDTIMVAAVSLCYPMLTIMMALGNLLAQGGSSIMSRSIGKKDFESVQRVSAFCFYISIILGIVLGIVFLVLRTPVLYMMGADASTIVQAKPYYTILAVGAPLVVLSYVPTNMLRAEGLPNEMMFASILGTIINLIFDPIFILAMHMGAFGAGLATVLGYIGTDIYCIMIILKKSKNFSILPKDFIRSNAVIAKEVFAIGAASAVMNILMSISQMLTNQALLVYGNDKIAAQGIAMKLFYVAFMVQVGFAFGAQPVLGYFYGARNKERLYKIIKQFFVFTIAIAAAFTVILPLIAPSVLPCFLKDEGIVSAGRQILFWQVITLIPSVLVLNGQIIFQSFGRAKFAMILSLTRQGILYIAVLEICRVVFGYMGVITSQSISNVLSAAISLILLAYTWKHRTL